VSEQIDHNWQGSPNVTGSATTRSGCYWLAWHMVAQLGKPVVSARRPELRGDYALAWIRASGAEKWLPRGKRPMTTCGARSTGIAAVWAHPGGRYLW